MKDFLDLGIRSLNIILYKLHKLIGLKCKTLSDCGLSGISVTCVYLFPSTCIIKESSYHAIDILNYYISAFFIKENIYTG